MDVTYTLFCFVFFVSPYVQSNQQEVHRIETIRQQRKKEERRMMMIELKQDQAIETYATKARQQYIDNLHIYLFIIEE